MIFYYKVNNMRYKGLTDYTKNNYTLNFCKNHNIDYIKDGNIIRVKYNDIIDAYNKELRVGDKIIIIPKKDVWKTNKKEFIITEKIDIDKTCCVRLNKYFGDHNHKTIFIGYIMRQTNYIRSKKLERIMK